MATKRKETRGRNGAAVVAAATVGGLILAVDLTVVGFWALVEMGLLSLN